MILLSLFSFYSAERAVKLKLVLFVRTENGLI